MTTGSKKGNDAREMHSTMSFQLTNKDIPAIAEVNPDKFGSFTPGTHIPIVSEQEARAMTPDYFLVFPWHFKDGILRREKEYLSDGGKMIFPFPEVKIVQAADAIERYCSGYPALHLRGLDG